MESPDGAITKYLTSHEKIQNPIDIVTHSFLRSPISLLTESIIFILFIDSPFRKIDKIQRYLANFENLMNF